METKVEVNGTPLPQRNGPSVDKKPINKTAGGNQNNNHQNNRGRGGNRFGRGGGGGGGGGGRDNSRSYNYQDKRKQQSQTQNETNNDNSTANIKQEIDRREDRDRKLKKSDDFLVNQKLKNLMGPTHELPQLEQEEVKYSGRNRLYIGNLTNDVTEEELKELFKPFGEISEAFINTEKNFAFLKVDYHANAEKAKRELDGSLRKNRPLRIRFAPNATAVKVKNLTQYVTNELLYKGFEIFGQVERAVIVVDDRGKSTSEGVVEFARKSGAMTAIRYCTEKCYFLTSSLRPCVVEPFEYSDDTDGYSEKALNKKNQDFYKARQTGPRFAEGGSFEHEYGTRWKQLHELYKQKHDALKREMHMEEEKLEAQMEYARYEHETEILREQLRIREQDRERQKIDWEIKERQAEEQRTREEEQMRRQQDEMQLRMHRQEEELRRRQQENTLFMQAQQLNNILDQQEMNQGRKNYDSNDNRRNYDLMSQGNNNMGNSDAGYMDYDHGQNRQSRFNDDQGGQGGNNNNGGRGGGGGNMNRQWNDRRGNNDENFQNKRRRF